MKLTFNQKKYTLSHRLATQGVFYNKSFNGFTSAKFKKNVDASYVIHFTKNSKTKGQTKAPDKTGY